MTRGLQRMLTLRRKAGYVYADCSDRMELPLADGAGHTFPPLAQRWILTWLLSSEAVFGGSDGPATHSKIFCQTPFSLQREKRL